MWSILLPLELADESLCASSYGGIGAPKGALRILMTCEISARLHYLVLELFARGRGLYLGIGLNVRVQALERPFSP
jgi:hypothetical protein